MEKVAKTIPTLYKVTAFATSTISRNNFFSNALNAYEARYNMIDEKLYSSHHTSQPVWEGNYHIKGDKYEIQCMLNNIVDCKENIKIYGHMDYDLIKV